MSKPKCASCGSDMDRDSGYWHEDYKREICSQCYQEDTDRCQLCGNEDLMPSDVSPFIVVKTELAQTGGVPPGIYRVMRRPFLSIPLIGGGSMDENNVMFTDKLPQFDSHYKISGHICNKCAMPYHKQFSEAYIGGPKQLSRHGYSRARWAMEKEHTRWTIKRNPDMLRDLESDKSCERYCVGYDWQQLREKYDLEDDLPTFHEYVAFEHRDVKVYGKDITSWLALAPDPKYRWGRNDSPLVFTASGLPTFAPPPWHDRFSASYYKQDSEYRAALLTAVEQGVLRQDGVYDQEGNPIRAR